MVSDINHGVEYKFLAPVPRATDRHKSRGRPHHGRRRHRGGQYTWRMKMLGGCSRSCGGGVQTLVATCLRSGVTRVVPDTRCDAGTRPMPRTEPCNRQPCPADWSVGDWGTCSVTCGSNGFQERRLTCRQQLAGDVSIPVAMELCPALNDQAPVTRRQCSLPDCPASSRNKFCRI